VWRVPYPIEWFLNLICIFRLVRRVLYPIVWISWTYNKWMNERMITTITSSAVQCSQSLYTKSSKNIITRELNIILLNSLKHDGNYVYHLFQHSKTSLSPTKHIYDFCMIFWISIDYFPIQLSFLWHGMRNFIYYLDKLHVSKVLDMFLFNTVLISK
jgi:hypothetical protein